MTDPQRLSATDEAARDRLRSEPVPWDDLAERRVLRALRDRMTAGEDDEAPERVRAPRRRALPLVVAAAAAALLCVAAVVAAIDGARTQSGGAPSERAHNERAIGAQRGREAVPDEIASHSDPAPEAPSTELTLVDGSRIIAERDPTLRVIEQSEEQVRIEQEAGRARYEVPPRPDRAAFVVEIDEVQVRVVGTVFEIDAAREHVGVRVERGEVEVTHAERTFRLRRGDAIELPRAIASAEAPGANSPPDAPDPAPRSPRARAERHPTIEEALDEVDRLRAQGKTRRAIDVLDKAVRRASRSPQRASAWFLLGRLQAAEGQSARAARAFRTAYDSDPRGPLAEDALAAEVRLRAAEQPDERARARRDLYLHRFPSGLHADSLKAMDFDP